MFSGGGVIRVEAQCFGKLVNRLVPSARFEKGPGQIVVSFDVVRIAAEREDEVVDGKVELSLKRPAVYLVGRHKFKGQMQSVSGLCWLLLG